MNQVCAKQKILQGNKKLIIFLLGTVVWQLFLALLGAWLIVWSMVNKLWDKLFYSYFFTFIF